jgi:LacI family transcriptional regulator
MRLAFVIDQEVTYYRRVLKGVAQFVRSRSDVELRIRRITAAAMLPGLDRAGYDGLILGTVLDDSEEAARLRIPAVSVSNHVPKPRFPLVVTDSVQVGRMVAGHLLAKGHRHFAFWGDGYDFAEQRWLGFSAAILEVRGQEGLPARSSASGRAIRRWLSRLPRPLGLMTATDARGSEMIDACHDLGLRVPEDVAVVGVDDDDLYVEMTDPALSSVAQQNERIGHLAAELLTRLVRGEKVEQLTLVPPGPLVARQSSAAVATGDTLVAAAVRFMEQNLTHGTNIDEMTAALGVSRRSLELRFKAALGRTPNQEFQRLKIERAQGLLATTTLPLKNIAALSGLGNAAQMSHVFRSSLGQTPTGYRRGFLLH